MTNNISRALNKKLQRPYQLIGGDKVEVDGEIRPLSAFDLSIELSEINNLDLANQIKAECKRRIYKVASISDQMNMLGLAGSDLFDSAQLSAFQAGLTWIKSMREASDNMILNGDVDFALDSKWPVCPQTVIDLAQQY